MMKRILFISCILFIGSLSRAQAPDAAGYASDTAAVAKRDLDYLLEDEKFNFAIPLWVPGFRGSFAYGGISLLPEFGDQNLGDRISDKELSVEFYLIGRLRFQYKRFYVEADGFSATLGSSLQFMDSDRITFLGTIDGTILRGTLGFKVFEHIEPGSYRRYAVYGYTGVRYYKLHIFTNRVNLLDIEPSWTDFLLGVRIPVQLKRWTFMGQADYGGFGTDDHHSWSASANASYRFSKLFSMGLGWTWLDFSHDKDFEFKNLMIDMQLTGPTLKLEFAF